VGGVVKKENESGVYTAEDRAIITIIIIIISRALD